VSDGKACNVLAHAGVAAVLAIAVMLWAHGRGYESGRVIGEALGEFKGVQRATEEMARWRKH
jgi:hypothetical protein